MIYRVRSVKPLENLELSVLFQNGVEKRIDIQGLFSVFPQFRVFENNMELFKQVRSDIGGYGIVWNDDLDLAADDIWENGAEVCIHDTDIVSSLAASLLMARSKAGMTQKQLAEKTGIYQADISSIERGRANPSLSTLKRLADGLDVSLKVEFVTE